MKQIADRKRVDIEFLVGDLVYVKLQPYRQLTLRAHCHQKLGLRYFGPFPVLEHIGKVAYHLSLPSTSRIHPVFHVSFLKKCVSDPSAQYFPLPLHSVEEASTLTLVKILDSRRLWQQGRRNDQVLIQWSNLPHAHSSWESISFIKAQFPTFDLGDKVPFNGGSVDMDYMVTASGDKRNIVEPRRSKRAR